VRARRALGTGGFAAAACVACCAPPIIAALGLTAGLAATAGIFLGLAAAIAVLLVGGAWILARTRRPRKRFASEPTGEPVPSSGANPPLVVLSARRSEASTAASLALATPKDGLSR
jgi:hypothetical protein